MKEVGSAHSWRKEIVDPLFFRNAWFQRGIFVAQEEMDIQRVRLRLWTVEILFSQTRNPRECYFLRLFPFRNPER